MQKGGYSFITAFKLDEKCWIENYFIPREIEEKKLMKKYTGNKTVEDYIKNR